MAELFYFDKGVFDQLPPVERTKFRALLKTNMIPNGRPFFLDDNGLPEQILDGFCKYLLCPQRASIQTWKTYANQVSIFIRFMTAQGKSWQQATKCDLDLYYTIRTSGEYQNQPALKDRSWNVAKSAIVHLYEYALDKGLIDSTPFKYRRSKTMFGGKHVETADLSAKYTPEPVNFISITNYQRIWRPLIANGENSQRNLALIDTLIVSGLRISEALNLDVHQLPDPDDQCYAGLKSVTLKVVGKGKKSRDVRIPKRIVRAIRFYCDEERAEILTRAKSDHTRKKSPKQSREGANKSYGTRAFTGNPLILND